MRVSRAASAGRPRRRGGRSRSPTSAWSRMKGPSALRVGTGASGGCPGLPVRGGAQPVAVGGQGALRSRRAARRRGSASSVSAAAQSLRGLAQALGCVATRRRGSPLATSRAMSACLALTLASFRASSVSAAGPRALGLTHGSFICLVDRREAGDRGDEVDIKLRRWGADARNDRIAQPTVPSLRMSSSSPSARGAEE